MSVYKGARHRSYNFKRTIILIAVITVALAAVCGAVFYLLRTHTIQTVYVEGNVHYTEDEIKAMVMDGALGGNSLYLSMKYKNRGIEDIPFLDAMDVSILSPDTIKIKVYEKALAGYVEYMDTFVYFDKDGYAVESSSVRTAGVPQVTGISFDYMVVGQPLPVKEGQEELFGTILMLTNLLQKYELMADRIYFQADNGISIYFGDVRVNLGNERDRLEDKLMILPGIVPKWQGQSGTFQMDAYDQNGKYIFKPN